jgi:hypothetical protein
MLNQTLRMPHNQGLNASTISQFRFATLQNSAALARRYVFVKRAWKPTT